MAHIKYTLFNYPGKYNHYITLDILFKRGKGGMPENVCIQRRVLLSQICTLNGIS